MNVEPSPGNNQVLALLTGLLASCVTLVFGFFLTRGAKASDGVSDQRTDIARHDVRLDGIDQTIQRLEALQQSTNATLTALVAQVTTLTSNVRANAMVDAKAARLVEDIRRIIERVREAQHGDHELISALHDRVRALEILLDPTNPKED